MSEQNEQENLFQNQSNENEGSDLVKEDGNLLNGSINNDGNKEKKGFDLLGSTYEDNIWNTNLDGNEKGKDIPKTYPGKKWRNARAIVLIIDIVLGMLGFLTYGLEILSTILMIIFIILWIKTVRMPENQEIVKERNIGKRLKGIIRLYAILTTIYVINDIYLVMNIEYTIDDVKNRIESLNSYDSDFYSYSKAFTDEEIIKVANEYAGCNCFGNNATQDTKEGFTSKEFDNIVKKVAFDRTIEGFLYEFKQSAQFGGIIERHEDELRKELINSANTIIGKNCFGSYTAACDLQSVNLEDLWEKTYTDTLNKVSPKVDNGEWK